MPSVRLASSANARLANARLANDDVGECCAVDLPELERRLGGRCRYSGCGC